MAYPPPAYPAAPYYPPGGAPPPVAGASGYDIGRVWLQNSTGPYLSANPNGQVGLAPHHKGWEEWTIVKLPNGKYSFRSFHNTFLRANPDGRIDLAPHNKEWETWEIVPSSADPEHQPFRSLRSFHNTFLRVDKAANVVNQAPHSKEWEAYHIHFVPPKLKAQHSISPKKGRCFCTPLGYNNDDTHQKDLRETRSQ